MIRPLGDWILPVFTGSLDGGFASGLVNCKQKLEAKKSPQIHFSTRYLMAFIGETIMITVHA